MFLECASPSQRLENGGILPSVCGPLMEQDSLGASYLALELGAPPADSWPCPCLATLHPCRAPLLPSPLSLSSRSAHTPRLLHGPGAVSALCP